MTLAGPARFQAEVRKSRFLAQAAPAGDPEQAMALLLRFSDPSATHNCWAWRVGSLYRSSDDNEPGGTAGRPILQAIDSQAVDRAVVVVTRWYGGIKLGAGGLARAYGGTAAECLRQAEKVPLVELVRLRIECAFEDLGAVHALLEQLQVRKLDESFSASGAQLGVEADAGVIQAFAPALRDATRNRARLLDLPPKPPAS